MVRRAEFLPAEVTDVHFETPDQEELTEAQKRTDALQEALTEDSEAFITIHQHPTGSGTTGGVFVDRIPADKYDHGELLIFLKQNYGPGDYRVRLYAKGKLKANTLLSIAKPSQNAGNGSQQITPGGDAAHLFNQMLQPLRETQAQLVQFMQQQKAPDPTANMMQTLQMLAMFKEVLGGGQQTNSLSQLKDALAIVAEIKGETIEGEKDEGGGFTEMVKALAPALAAGMQQTKQPQQPYQPNPAPKPAQGNPQNMMLLNGLKMLIGAAAKKADPGTYANMVMDFAPAETIEKYCTSVEAFAGLMKQAGPQAINYAGWFEDLRQHLLAQLGHPSKYSDLYGDPDDAITGEIDQETPPDASDVPAATN